MKKNLLTIDTYLGRFEKQFSWLLSLGTIALLIGVPAYPKFPLIEVPGTYVSIRAEDFLLGIVSLFWILAMRRNIFSLARLRIVQAILFFLAVGWISTISALLITQTVVPLQALLHTMRRFEYILIFFFMISVIKTRQDLWAYVRVVLVGLVLVIVYGLGQKVFLWPIISTMNKEYSQGVAQSIMPGGRINSTFAGHYDLAAYSVLIMGLLWGAYKGVSGKLSKIWALLLILGTFWLLIVSASRISFAAYLGSVVFTLWLVRLRWWIVPVVAVSIIASAKTPALTERYIETLKYEFLPRLAAIHFPRRDESEQPLLPTPTPLVVNGDLVEPVVSAAITPSAPTDNPGTLPTSTDIVATMQIKTYNERSFAGTQTQLVALPEDRSTAIRFNVEWPRALRALIKSPLLGTGYSSITLATDNDYLRALGETGILGFLALGLIMWELFLLLLRIYRHKPLGPEDYIALGLGGGCLGFLANALFIDVLEASKVAIYFWAMIGMIVAISRFKDTTSPHTL